MEGLESMFVGDGDGEDANMVGGDESANGRVDGGQSDGGVATQPH